MRYNTRLLRGLVDPGVAEARKLSSPGAMSTRKIVTSAGHEKDLELSPWEPFAPGLKMLEMQTRDQGGSCSCAPEQPSATD